MHAVNDAVDGIVANIWLQLLDHRMQFGCAERAFGEYEEEPDRAATHCSVPERSLPIRRGEDLNGSLPAGWYLLVQR